MSNERMSAGQLMVAARPFAVDEFDDACDDAVGRRTLSAIVANGAASPGAADVTTLGAPPAVHPPRRGAWSYGVSVAAVAAAIATIVTVALTTQSSHAPATSQPTSSARPAVSSTPTKPTAVSSAPSTVTRSQADAAAQACVADVRTTLHSMITAYQRPGGGKAAAQSRLRSRHAPSSVEYARDAAAFGDWLARGGARGQVTVAAVAGHACVQ